MNLNRGLGLGVVPTVGSRGKTLGEGVKGAKSFCKKVVSKLGPTHHAGKWLLSAILHEDNYLLEIPNVYWQW